MKPYGYVLFQNELYLSGVDGLGRYTWSSSVSHAIIYQDQYKANIVKSGDERLAGAQVLPLVERTGDDQE